MASDAGLVPAKPLRQVYEVGGEFMTTTSVSWRKVQVASPVTEGSYTVHAVREMVTENVPIMVRGANNFEMQLNLKRLEELFARLDYRLRLEFDDYRETWSCQTAEYSTERSRVYAHNGMAIFTATVPRFPTATVERIV
jgi:hypothetical protein